MRARLNTLPAGDEFHFLCLPKMADSMEPVVIQAGGEIVHRDDRSYGVVISVRKITE